MALPTTWTASLLFITALTVHTVKSASHVVVRPIDSDPSVCGDHVTCDTLANFVSSNSVLFSETESDLALIFLNGTHTIDAIGAQSEVRIEKKENLTLFGVDAVIVCKVPLPFVFFDIQNLELKGLTFSKCGGEVLGNSSKLHYLSAALFLNNINALHLERVTVNQSTGYGLFTLDLYGSAYILNCIFEDNNENCFIKNKDLCIGGNIAMHFFNGANTSGLVNVSITESIVEGGRDWSGYMYRCEDQEERPSSPSAFRANGLAVIFAQDSFTVDLKIYKTRFHDNIQKDLPAILIHDYSTVTNNIEFHDSSFDKEGKLLFSAIKHDKFQMTSLPKIFTIEKCSFVKGFSGVQICINSAKVINNHFQTISISDCQFYRHGNNFAPHSSKAIIEISYSFKYSEGLPSMLITIERCTFLGSTISFLTFYLKQDSFLNHLQPTDSCHRILIIKYSQFELTKGPYSPLEMIVTPQSVHRRSNMISFIEFLNCTLSSSIQVRNANIMLRGCLIFNSESTPVNAMDSVIALDGQNIFKRNRGDYGGAFRLKNSKLLLMPNSETIISKNIATYGGGIYAEQDNNLYTYTSGIHDCCTVMSDTDTARISFMKNQARIAGNSVFGGNYINCRYNCGTEQCQVVPGPFRRDLKYLLQDITLYSNDTRNTEISSPANRICLCEDNKPTAKCSAYNVTAFPGQKFNISLIALGELNGSVPVTLIAASSSKLKIDNRLRFLSVHCTATNFSVHRMNLSTNLQTVTLKISKETPTPAKSADPESFTINVHLSPCPPGTIFSSNSHKCECHNFLKKFNIKCNAKNGEIEIKNKQWIGYFINSELVVTNGYSLDYLSPGDRSINLSRPDEQCNLNRSGVLCGACQPNLSMVLGTSNCRECSNVYLLLIIPFALAGVALVVLLLKCNLTVSVGHINGIIFYANIVQINKTLLFSNQSTAYQVLSTFIAWANLDLGIEVCFFKNMDTYAKVWLQFVFPVYLWFIIILIITAAHYSLKMERLIGDNSVPVLATLFLLSYAKLLRAIIAAISFTFIEFEGGSYSTVWLQDGNLRYDDPKHTALFLMALAFALLYILPLTLLVLLTPCLQAWSHHKAFKWVNRLKPFLDAYQGPYSNKFRYWTGLFLVLRVILFLIDASNYENDPSMSFFSTVMILFPFAILCLIKRNIYRHKLANCIEIFSLLNIVILCSVNWLTMTTSYRKWHPIGEHVTYTSVAVMMLVFLLIVFYQVCTKIASKFIQKKKNNQEIIDEAVQETFPAINTPTYSEVEINVLREPLLETDEH